MLTKETKPGTKTSEFWLVVIANVLVNIGAIDVGDSKIRGILAIVSLLGYTLSRGLAKHGQPAENVVVIPGAHDPEDEHRHG